MHGPEALERAAKEPPEKAFASLPEQFAILIQCKDEKEQAALLRRFMDEGLACKALLV
jgi:hypothetical protein